MIWAARKEQPAKGAEMESAPGRVRTKGLVRRTAYRLNSKLLPREGTKSTNDEIHSVLFVLLCDFNVRGMKARMLGEWTPNARLRKCERSVLFFGPVRWRFDLIAGKGVIVIHN